MKGPTSRVVLGCIALSLGWLSGCDPEPGAWEAALATDSIEVYEAYIEQFPHGDHVVEAADRLASMFEAQAWDVARSEGTIEGLQSFLSDYADGAYSSDAIIVLTPLLEVRAWEAAVDVGSIEALRDFTGTYPESPRATEAESAIRLLTWARGTSGSVNLTTMGVFMGGYTRFVNRLDVMHELESDLGSAEVQYTVSTGDDHYLDMSRDRTMLARNGTNPDVSGRVLATASDGTVTEVELVGIIWSPNENLVGSWLYSYDTGLGVSHASNFAGLTSTPPLDEETPFAAFRIAGSGVLVPGR